MAFKNWLKGWETLDQSSRLAGRRRSGKARARARLGIELLEDRTVPTVLIQSAFGGDTIYWCQGNTAGHPDNEVITGPITDNPTAVNSPLVYFIFWGPSWTQDKAKLLAKDAQVIHQSNFLSSVKDYGSDGKATYGDYTIDSTTAQDGPPASTQEIQKIVPNTTWAKPKDNSPTDAPIYVTVNGTGGGAGNGPDSYTPDLKLNHIWMNVGDLSEDNFTDLLSHELAERLSSGTDAGIRMRASVAITSESDNAQIADNEPDQGYYTYRINGQQLVQAYWSLSAHQFIIPDDNTQSVFLDPTPGWKMNGLNPPTFNQLYDLTIKAGQEGPNVADNITIDTDKSGNRLTINENGEVFQFNVSSIRSITVNLMAGGNGHLNVPSLPKSITLTVTTPAGSTANSTDSILIGSDGLPGPTGFGLHDLSRVLGTIVIDASGITGNVTDADDANSRAVQLVTAGPNIDLLTWDSTGLLEFGKAAFTSLSITGGVASNDSFQIATTPTGTTTNLYTRTSNAQVNVLATGGALTINGPGTVNVSGLAGLGGALTVTGDSTTTLELNDQDNRGDETYTITRDTVQSSHSPLISYGGLHSLTLDGGTLDPSSVPQL
jgi:hypothetical protein